MQSEHRRRQILDDDAKEARFTEDSPQAEDSWVSSFMGRLAALVRDVSGREK